MKDKKIKKVLIQDMYKSLVKHIGVENANILIQSVNINLYLDGWIRTIKKYIIGNITQDKMIKVYKEYYKDNYIFTCKKLM